MEVYRGEPQDPDFQEWLNRLKRNKRGRIVAVATDAIFCHRAREVISRGPSLRHSFAEEDFETALIHLATCRDRGCRAILIQFTREQSKVS